MYSLSADDRNPRHSPTCGKIRQMQFFINNFSFNPLVRRVQKIKIRNLSINQLLIVEFVKKMGYLGAHYSERQGLMG